MTVDLPRVGPLRRARCGRRSRAGDGLGPDGALRGVLRALTVGGALASGGLVVGAPGAAALAPQGAMGTAVPQVEATGANGDSNPVVVIGVAGLRWSDITRVAAPTLYEAAGAADIATLSVRTHRSWMCPTDAWLTLGAGAWAADPVTVRCRAMPVPVDDPEGTAPRGDVPTRGGAVPRAVHIPEWDRLRAGPKDPRFAAELGQLAAGLERVDRCVVAAGPGAALAAADEAGKVAHYLDDPLDIGMVVADGQGAAGRCGVVIADLGSVDVWGSPDARTASVTRVDDQVKRLVAGLPDGVRVILAGVADSGPVPAGTAWDPPARGLRLLMDTTTSHGRFRTSSGVDSAPSLRGTLLRSPSTRWTGLAQLADVTTTVLAAAGAQAPPSMIGAVWAPQTPHPAASAPAVRQVAGIERGADIRVSQAVPFYVALGGLAVGACLTTYRLLRRAGRGVEARTVHRTGVAVTVLAALPVATFLVNLAPWWRWPAAVWWMWLGIAGWTAAVALLGLRGPRWGAAVRPSVVIATVTAVVMGLDVVTGSHLQRMSMLGLSPVTGGRFYGFSNIPFSLFAGASLVAATAAAAAARRAGWRRPARAALVGVIGALAIGIDGAPKAGADFGGVLALTPGVLVLTVLVAGIRLTWARLVGVGLSGMLLVAVISVLDYLRPEAQRSHFGGFVASVLDGSAWAQVVGKAVGALSTFAVPLTWVLPLVYIVIWRSFVHPSDAMSPPLERLVGRWPEVRALVVAGLVTAAFGGVLNDSGATVTALVIGTVGVFIAIDLVACTVPGHGDVVAALRGGDDG